MNDFFLKTPIQFLKGVGPALAEILKTKEIYYFEDLLNYFPRAYINQKSISQIKDLKAGQSVCFEGLFESHKFYPIGRFKKKSLHEVKISDSSGKIVCRFFKSPYKGYFKNFISYQKVKVLGKVVSYRNKLELHHPDIIIMSDEKSPNDQEGDILEPIYSEIQGLSQKKIRTLILTLLEKISQEKAIEDIFPKKILKQFNFPDLLTAYKQIHYPDKNQANLYESFRTSAHKRFIFEDFFNFYMSLFIYRRQNKSHKVPVLKSVKNLITFFVNSLDFDLTEDQKKVFKEVKKDLTSGHPMCRLIQGDVGCGKTIVAFMSLLSVCEARGQGAMMLPTEVLAFQTYEKAKLLLEPLGVHVEFLTGSSKASERAVVLKKVKNGNVDILIGTHALLEQDVKFKKLKLTVIDEQHRFGVRQRQILQEVSDHFLLLTATPIPRTLAMTLYGDLDISFIYEKPKNRGLIQTAVRKENKREAILDFIQNELSHCRQAYVVYPLVEASEVLDLKNAKQECENLKTRFPNYQVSLMHGRMKSEEKKETLKKFKEGKIHVLVATTVVEVGLDVGNATVMMVEHAERFGLSQLHQLRGRIGRSEHKGYFILMLSYAASAEAYERVQVLEQTNDGFMVAEKDLEIRGFGDIFGHKQSGLPVFKVGNLIRDSKILEEAKNSVEQTISQDPELSQFSQSYLKSLHSFVESSPKA